MKFGINAFLWTAAFQEKNLPLIPKVKAMGFDGIELCAFDFATFPAAKIRKELEANQLEATFCTALTGTQNIGSADDSIRNGTIEEKKNPQATWPLTNEQLVSHWSVMTPARVNCCGPPKFSTW